jgi:hypothetical protein
MKDIALQITQAAKGEKLHTLREYVQNYILFLMQKTGMSSSLFSGKCHALLMRVYTKGRDVYDLFWYRTKHKDLLPNFELLNNALQQTRKGYVKVTPNNWLEILEQRIHSLDWKAIENDVLPFLEFQDELLSFTRENLLMLLK